MKRFIVLALSILLTIPAFAGAATVADLEQQLKDLKAEIEELSERTDATEMHTATDNISWYGDLRVKADSINYKNVTNVEMPFRNGIDTVTAASGYTVGFNMNPDGTLKRETKDLRNAILYTTRVRLGMKAEVWDNVNFSGRLNMYKNWGDSTGVKVFDSWTSYTMDGTNGGNTTGDFLRVERAYFDWKHIGGTNAYLSIGRRPSTYGPSTQYRENELRGGTPTGHLVNFNFDGITVGYHLSELTGIEGMTARFCYGQGYESEFGNGELFNQISVKDTHLGGFNIDALNDGTNFLQLTLFRAQDVTDGFKGVLAVPTGFLPQSFQDAMFPGFNMITRVQPSTNIGSINLLGIGFSREEENDIKWFGSFGMTQTDPNGKAGLFGGLLSDAEMLPSMSATSIVTPDGSGDIVAMFPTGKSTDDSKESGYSVYVGIQVPAPMGKFGLEYNYGSEFWIPFTQAQDDIVGSKLATRGHVGEAYYIVDVNPNMFIKVAGLYYDYEYTGSGAPVGAPKKVDDVIAGKAYSMLPVVDKAYDANVSLTVKF
jgi:hypothetical protein